MIEPEHETLSIARQCHLLSLPRSSYYRCGKLVQESEENLALMRLIDEQYTRYPFYGSRQMRNALRRQGYKVNRKRIRRLMPFERGTIDARRSCEAGKLFPNGHAQR